MYPAFCSKKRGHFIKPRGTAVVSGRGNHLRFRLGREVLDKMKTFEVQKTLQVRCYLQKNIKEIHKNGWHHKIHYFSELFEFRRKIQPKCFTKTPGQNNVFSHYFFGAF